MSFTTADLDEIERLSRKATPGPLEIDGIDKFSENDEWMIVLHHWNESIDLGGMAGKGAYELIAMLPSPVDSNECVQHKNTTAWANAQLFVALRNSIDDMAAELRRAWEAEAAMQKWIGREGLHSHECNKELIYEGSECICGRDAALAHAASPLTQEVERLRKENQRLKLDLDLHDEIAAERTIAHLGMEPTVETSRVAQLAARIKELELENDHWKNCYQELEEYNNKKIEELEVEITQLNRKV